MTIGEKIKELRKSKGLSQEKLAGELFVSRAAVAKWESDNGIPDIDNLKKISGLFKVSLDELLDNKTVQDEVQACKLTENEDAEPRNRNYYDGFIGKRCNVCLRDWNDGVSDAYIIGQDKDFVFYVVIKRGKKIVGAIGKGYIEKMLHTPEKREKNNALISDMINQGISRRHFINQTADIYLEDKHIWSGILTEDNEFLDVGIADISDTWLTLATERTIEIEKVAKIEVAK